ncbi:MAG: hypothetical protein HOF43_01185, partial [Chloroflexi bacterium]|nr:hypothetical protein [Chloroflexota bacterium]
LVLAIVFGLLSVWVGLTVAFYADLAAGGSIVLTTVAMLILSEVLGRIRDSLPSRRTLVNPADDSSSASVQELDTAGE